VTPPRARLPMLLLLAGLLAATAPGDETQEYTEAWQFFQQGRYAEAIGGFKRYIAKHPRGKLLPEAYFTLARIEPSGNNAFVHYQFILDNYPAHALASQACFATAQYYQNVGAMADAKARYLMTYSRYGQTAAGSESLYRLALLAVQADSLEPAAAYARTFTEQYPSNVRASGILAALAERCLAKGDTALARDHWRAVLERHPTSFEAGAARERLLETMPEAAADTAAADTGAVQAAPLPVGKQYYIQIGAYKDRRVLDDWLIKMRAKDYPMKVDSSAVGTKKLYRLRVGPYRTRPEAAEIGQRLKAREGVQGIVVEE
jgi:TolA-binding protein